MKTNVFRSGFVRKWCVATIAVAATTTLVGAQTPVYWNEDAPPVTNPPTPNLYLDQGDNYVTTDPSNADPGQITAYSSGDYVVFSSDTVVAEAQTVQVDTEDFIFGLEFNKGAITLADDGGASSIIDLGDNTGATSSGLTIDSTVNGTTTISPTTINLLSSQQWNNNSSQDLIVGGAVSGSVNPYTNLQSVLTFDGGGTGAVRITGSLAAEVAVDQESTTSTLYLSNTNNFGVTSLLIDKGTVVATNEGSIGNQAISLENGGTLTFTNAINMGQAVNVTGGGTINMAGDSLLSWGSGSVNADTLTLGSGDDLDVSSGTQNIQTLDLVAGTSFSRLIVGINGQGYGLLANTQQINVGTGYILDFGGTYQNQSPAFNGTVTSAINVANGGAIESRNSGTTTLTDVTLPLTGTFVFGADDDGQGGSVVITNSYVLPGTFTVAQNGHNENGVFSGNFSGAGGLVITGADANSYDPNPYDNAAIWLKGTNTYQGSTDVQFNIQSTTTNGNYVSNQPSLYIAGDNSGTGNDYEIQGGALFVDPAGKLPTTAIVSLNGLNNDPSDQSHYLGGSAYFVIGDGNGVATATIAGLNSGGGITDVNIQGSYRNAYVGGGAYNGGTSTLILDPVANQVVEYQGQIGNGYSATYNAYEGNGNIYSSAGGAFFNNLKLVKTGAGTQMLDDQNNDFAGGTEIDGGVLAVFGGDAVWDTGANQVEYNQTIDATHILIGSAAGAGTVTINNGATLDDDAAGGGNFFNIVTLGTAGSVTYGGDTWQAAGTIASYNPYSGQGYDYNVYGQFVGGGGLVIGAGDLLARTSTAGSPGNIYVVGGRLLMFNNTTFIDGATSVVTADGGILDFGNGDSSNTTENTAIYFSDGGAIEDRGTDEVLTNVQPLVGTSGALPTLTIGTDDGGGGSITITNSVNLTNSAGGAEIIGVFADNRNFTFSNFSGGFSGTGNLSVDTAALANGYITQDRGLIFVSGTNTYKGDTIIKGGELDLTGSSAAVTSATGGAPNYYVSTSTKTYTDSNSNVQSVQTAGILQVGKGGSLADDAHIILGGATAGTQGYLAIGDLFGATDLTVGSITANAGGGAIFNGDYADRTMETLTVNVAANTTDTYTGTIGSDPYGYNFGETAEGTSQLNNANQLSLVKSGSGTLALNGQNNYAGTTTVNGGKLNINTVLNSGVTVNAGGAIGGSGFIKGMISGAGAVTLGDPTVLVANAVDPSGGMSFNLEFSLTGQPNYGSAGNSGNDVLHLESGSPFAAAFTLANVFNIYLAGNGTFDGGIFVNGGDALTANNIADATFNYYILNNIGGTVSYDGNRYSLVSDVGGTASETTFQAFGAGFDDGTTDGFEQQITVSGAVIPEPSTYALMAIAGLAFLCIRRRAKA